MDAMKDFRHIPRHAPVSDQRMNCGACRVDARRPAEAGLAGLMMENIQPGGSGLTVEEL